MKRGAVGLVVLAVLFLSSWSLQAAEEPKGLAPGLLSLDGTVGILDQKIEEGKSVVEKALGINISGFFDVGYTWSSNRAKPISGRYFDKDHNDLVFNYFNLTLEKPEKDWGVGFKLVGDFGRSAELLREATLWGPKLVRESSAELREAFLTTTIPIGEGLQVKAGKFVTLMGTEIIPAPGSYNPNISRSFLFNLAIPFTHTGLLLSYPVTKSFTLMGGAVTGWDNPRDNNNSPSFHGGFTYTPAEAFSLTTSVMAGPEQSNNTSRQRVAVSNVATIKPMDPLTVFLEYTYGNEGGNWQGFAAIGSYDWTARFNTALRAEYFHDKTGSRTGVSNLSVGEATLTAAYKFTAKLLGRFEVRQDWGNKPVFAKGNTSADSNQTTLALQAIYGF
ncbi:MAG: hypothetical protein A3F90_00915 [Deltaproteobacteria bacterium RIFCSPLOWO2_12_FULL_60_19]|nr:MAG: hypothetical protein A3F90_00915 [Deltaproteobacteria bacterium RIFCSPLOWO2_12_FULL_60_19]